MSTPPSVHTRRPQRRPSFVWLRLRRLLAIGVVCISSVVFGACSGSQQGMRLIFDDEFNGTSVDSTKWNALSGHPWGVPAYFTPQDVSVGNGNLDLLTERRSSNGYPYTTGMVTTQGKFSFLYGRVDIRARLPMGQGIWPGFWMLPPHQSPQVYEIDIMEMLGNHPNTVYMTVWHQSEYRQCRFHGPDYSADFHVFSIVWTASSVTWLIDDMQRCRITTIVPNTPMELLLDSWVGTSASWPGAPNASTAFPQHAYVDYVRVYQDA